MKKPKHYIQLPDGEFEEIKGIPKAEIGFTVLEKETIDEEEALFDILYNAQLSRGLEAKA